MSLTKGVRGYYTSDWWPNIVNLGVTLRAVNILTSCMHELHIVD